jgi:hypothetical protein
MKKLDRIILIVLVIGVWGLIGTMWLKPSNVDAHDDGHTHNSYEVYGVAEESHSHDYAVSYHDHDYAEESHSHTCDVDGSYATCY